MENLRGRKSTLSGPHIPVPTFPLSTPPGEFILVYETLCKILLSFRWIRKWFQPNSFKCATLGRTTQIYAIISNFENFENALCMKSVSMPLNLMHAVTWNLHFILQRYHFTQSKVWNKVCSILHQIANTFKLSKLCVQLTNSWCNSHHNKV